MIDEGRRWRDARRCRLRTNIKHWRFRSISYMILGLLDLVCVLLRCFKIAAAVAAGTFAWLMIVSLIFWFICFVGCIFLSIAASREWYILHKEIKELENE